MFSPANDRFSDDSVACQFQAGLSLSSLSPCFNYEGRTTTAGRRVTGATVRTARRTLGRSRARTIRGRQRILQRAGVVGPTGQLERNNPRARQLNAREVAARTVARRERRTAGTRTGRARTRRRIARERAAVAARRRRR
jgi:hypothetical protein